MGNDDGDVTMMNDDGQVVNINRLLLQPEEAGLWDLVLLLWSSDLENRKFVDCSQQRQTTAPVNDFHPRWLIFISVVFQKLFLVSKGTLDKVGRGLEMWLNLLSTNGGFLHLLFNLTKREVEWPERSSAEFRSLIGNLDMRVDMEKEMEPEYQGEASTQAIVFKDTKSDPNLTTVAFRGTSPFDAAAWCTDLDLSWYQIQGVGKIHRGFMKALGLQKNGWPLELTPPPHQNDTAELHPYAYYAMREMLREELRKDAGFKFIVTGHSLGGALAILFVGVLAMHGEAELLQRLEGVYTFGQPRVGDQQFGEFMEGKLKEYDVKYLRFVYANDVVPRLPYDDKTLFYKHFGPTLFYNSCYKVKVMEEEPNKNYFGVLWVVPKVLNAVWELVRSFIGPWISIKGKEMRETWLMRVFRVIGLVLPGLANHCPQDYHNCTRFGAWPKSLHGYSDEKLIHVG
ncbi:Triacylglycerol lipase OBL1 [Linum grandiflorum]